MPGRSEKRVVCTHPSKKALAAVIDKVRTICLQTKNQPLLVLLYRLNPVLRGWCHYFQHGVSAACSLEDAPVVATTNSGVRRRTT